MSMTTDGSGFQAAGVLVIECMGESVCCINLQCGKMIGDGCLGDYSDKSGSMSPVSLA